MRQGIGRRPLVLAFGLGLAIAASAPAADQPGERAEAAAARAERAAERSEAAATRVDDAVSRLERILERLEQQQAAKRRARPTKK
jgi:hypothetical protein